MCINRTCVYIQGVFRSTLHKIWKCLRHMLKIPPLEWYTKATKKLGQLCSKGHRGGGERAGGRGSTMCNTKCSGLCGSPMATPEVQLSVFPHCTDFTNTNSSPSIPGHVDRNLGYLGGNLGQLGMHLSHSVQQCSRTPWLKGRKNMVAEKGGFAKPSWHASPQILRPLGRTQSRWLPNREELE